MLLPSASFQAAELFRGLRPIAYWATMHHDLRKRLGARTQSSDDATGIFCVASASICVQTASCPLFWRRDESKTFSSLGHMPHNASSPLVLHLSYAALPSEHRVNTCLILTVFAAHRRSVIAKCYMKTRACCRKQGHVK